ncbi:thymidylate synthase [Halodesulfurarchaeum sp. HSR-GB]|uniref:thymidylate synthase n=1 Tax=Halodesulfurarchaeum sp. HSR-GB TaxID=3074077 RepID=UPI0028572683|nr:thymidylate synthase [Halodesulfurarchaeum sp. HSR-GB]MDR5656121.1 thymidylate synthase [Halodesulfurarchaeum sp. HSR-GB]
MQQYLDLVESVLRTGTYEENRTGVDTLADFSQHYTVDLQAGFPLLTTKDLSRARWNSLVQELIWYLSGEEHIRTLREETGIWDAWADEEGHLDTAYGRFWRRYPVPAEADRLPGESWPDPDSQYLNEEGTFDQIAYVLDGLQHNPESRRLVVNAWHPANAADSTLPPCHYTFVFNVQDGRLNTHLQQRSGDIALGIPFNIASYALLTHAVANQVGLPVGEFGHSIVDAHIYLGKGDRGSWYEDHAAELRERVTAVEEKAEYAAIREWIETTAPPDPEGYDHVPGLLTQLTRAPRDRPEIEIADRSLDSLSPADITLSGYDPAPAIDFAVAE